MIGPNPIVLVVVLLAVDLIEALISLYAADAVFIYVYVFVNLRQLGYANLLPWYSISVLLFALHMRRILFGIFMS
jgi:hypothetical protein